MAAKAGFRTIVLIAGVLAASSGLTGLAVARPATSVPHCFGKAATIYAPGSNRHVVGTKHNDVIVAMGAGDVISGGAGNDLICAGAAKSIDGGAGNDKISFSGNGTAHGGTGNDTIILGKGNGTAYGDAGNDILTAGAGKQHLHGGAGNDRLTGGTNGTYVLDGDAGNDVLIVKGAHTTLDGGAGVDSLIVPAKFESSSTVVPDPLDLLNGQHETAARTSVAAPLPPTSTAPAVTPGPSLGATLEYMGEAGTSDITVQTSYPFPSQEFQFGATLPAGDTLASWTLDPGDGSAPRTGYDNLPPTYQQNYEKTGSYTASLVVKDTHGSTVTASVVIDVAPAPTIDDTLPAAAVSGFDGTIDLSSVRSPGSVVNSVVVTWGDGDLDTYTSLAPSVSHHYVLGGHFQALVVITTDHGGLAAGVSQADVDTDHAHANLFVDDPSSVWNEALQGVIPAGGQLNTVVGVSNLLDPETSSSQGPHPASIDYGDGDVVTTGMGAYHTYSAAGTYTLTLTAWDGSVSDVKTVHVDVVAAGASLDMSRPVTTATVGEPVTLSASPDLPAGDHITGFSYEWGDGDPDAWEPPSGTFAPSATHVYTTPGIYTVGAAALTDHGELLEAPVMAWYQILVTGPTPTIDLKVGPTPDYDADENPQETRWFGTSAGGDVALWAELIPATGETFTHADLDPGDGTGTTVTDLTPNPGGDYLSRTWHEYDTAGNYTANLTVYDTAGPVFHEAVSVGVEPAPAGP